MLDTITVAKIQGLKATVHDKSGRMLAVTGWTENNNIGVKSKHRLLGYEWKEFVDEETTERLLAWWAEDDPGEPITYSTMGIIVCLVKIKCGSNWCCIGDACYEVCEKATSLFMALAGAGLVAACQSFPPCPSSMI